MLGSGSKDQESAGTGETPAPAKLSPVEGIKTESRFLRGTLALELAQESDHFDDKNKQLLKFHGTYQQDDRDARKNRNKEGVGRYYMFMVRCKIPGGKVTADQYLAVDELADRYANGTLRLTSRQGIQLHGIVKGGLKDTIAGINHCLLTTLGACGDVERNVMAPPAPFADALFTTLQKEADRIADHLAPKGGAYHEIWLGGRKLEGDLPPEQAEPIYGKVYLPRKFKTGLALPQDNSVDIYAQDLGFLAEVLDGKIAGYDVLVGGGMGRTHGKAETFPFLARHICWIRPDRVVETAEAVVKLFRDHGNRADRKRARIKYLVHDWGVERFREVLAGYLPFPLELPHDVQVTDFPLHLGWHAQGDGKFFYGIGVENGRIQDAGGCRQRTALRELVRKLRPTIRLTPVQDILLCDLPESARATIETTLQVYGVPLPSAVSPARSHSMACPAIPTCGLAISEAERALPSLIDDLDRLLAELQLDGEKLSVRMTGCPNGCVRPYQSDLGIVGRSGDKYLVFAGGNLLGTRLNFPIKDLVPLKDIVPTLKPLLARFKADRRPEEGLGDFCTRLGEQAVQALVQS